MQLFLIESRPPNAQLFALESVPASQIGDYLFFELHQMLINELGRKFYWLQRGQTDETALLTEIEILAFPQHPPYKYIATKTNCNREIQGNKLQIRMAENNQDVLVVIED